ncbi:hypothetical protein BU26DRAFT_424836 [Trematosphaeria pertusa]|uniref:C2H2-type domain-containing protein n=1 Tax=Trematosphaeria pertusa TaxID=390896 RepID=A0A6A6IKP6_9PLEO|nr:uncharacterized protein BU26DRAFT_424836 [Trematosphaeria pertusa]KAF2250422.1 hypothetical protein BU26DRAFT_424836 [Trematosphaeria pertusa]
MVEVPRPERSPFVVPRKPFPNSSSRYVAPPQSPRSSMETSSPETRANVPYATPTDIHPSASPRTQGQEANATSHTCPECPLSFPTAGQRNKHVNRKHRRRYICPISSCQKAFSLNADMERHKKTVHKELFSFSDSMLKCPLSKCKTPEKLYSRKDNLDRHVKRCFASAKMEKGKGKAG